MRGVRDRPRSRTMPTIVVSEESSTSPLKRSDSYLFPRQFRLENGNTTKTSPRVRHAMLAISSMGEHLDSSQELSRVGAKLLPNSFLWRMWQSWSLSSGVYRFIYALSKLYVPEIRRDQL